MADKIRLRMVFLFLPLSALVHAISKEIKSNQDVRHPSNYAIHDWLCSVVYDFIYKFHFGMNARIRRWTIYCRQVQVATTPGSTLFFISSETNQLIFTISEGIIIFIFRFVFNSVYIGPRCRHRRRHRLDRVNKLDRNNLNVNKTLLLCCGRKYKNLWHIICASTFLRCCLYRCVQLQPISTFCVGNKEWR